MCADWLLQRGQIRNRPYSLWNWKVAEMTWNISGTCQYKPVFVGSYYVGLYTCSRNEDEKFVKGRTLLWRLLAAVIVCISGIQPLLFAYPRSCWCISQVIHSLWPPLWSSGQSSWLLTQRSWLRFPALPKFLCSSGSGTASTQHCEDKWGATRKLRLTTMGDPPSWLRDIPQKLALNFADKWRSLSRYTSLSGLRATEFVCLFVCTVYNLHLK
jgi:hypothetical protein